MPLPGAVVRQLFLKDHCVGLAVTGETCTDSLSPLFASSSPFPLVLYPCCARLTLCPPPPATALDVRDLLSGDPDSITPDLTVHAYRLAFLPS